LLVLPCRRTNISLLLVAFTACAGNAAIGHGVKPRSRLVDNCQDASSKSKSRATGSDVCSTTVAVNATTIQRRTSSPSATTAVKSIDESNRKSSEEGVLPQNEPPLWVPIQIEDKSQKALLAFYTALHRAQRGEGQARITFYGASHVASDVYPGVIRQKLQQRFGDSGPGFVLPVKPWRWYRRSGINFEATRGWKALRVKAPHPKEDRYGYAGVALESKARFALGAIETRGIGGLQGVANRFELFYLKQPRGGHMVVFIDGQRVRRLSTESEQFETAYETFEVPNENHRFEIRTQGDGLVRVFGMAVESEGPGVVLDTLGIPGARACNHLLWDDAIYREHIARRNPDLIVLAYGTNESGDDDVPIKDYETCLRRVIERIRETVPHASCVLIGPSDRPLKEDGENFLPRPRTEQIIEVQRRLSSEFSCGFFDLVAFMGGPLSMLRWVAADPPYGAPDYIHFTFQGYQRLGEVFYQALISGYSDQENSP
jgi:lysophospholipase L1-like esterase